MMWFYIFIFGLLFIILVGEATKIFWRGLEDSNKRETEEIIHIIEENKSEAEVTIERLREKLMDRKYGSPSCYWIMIDDVMDILDGRDLE